MKKTLYLLLLACFGMASALAQTQTKKKFQVFQGKPGITKKVSELRAASTSRRAMPERPPKEMKEFDMKEFKKFDKAVENIKPGKEGLKEESAAENSSVLAEEATPSTQKIWSNFLASTFEEFPFFFPPDPNGAVGPSQVVVVTNNMVKVFGKRGVTDPPLVSHRGTLHTPATSQFDIPLYFFFYPALTDGFPSDPHIRFDRLTKRWFITAIEAYQSAPSNNILLAVSDGERITDETNFTFYQIPTDLLPRNSASGAPFFDYPRQGVDANAILIGGSAFFTHTDSCGFSFADSLHSVGYALDKKALLHGFLGGYVLQLGSWQFNAQNTGSGIIIPQGVYNDNPAAPKSYFAGINLTGIDPNAGDAIVLAGLTYDNNGFLTDITETTLPVGQFQYPREITALGSALPIDALDGRLLEVSIYKNKVTGRSALWTAHAIGLNQSGGFVSFQDFDAQARTGSRWYQIGDIYTKPKVTQSGTVYDAAQASGRRAISYFNPSIAASGQGHAVLGGTTAAYNRYLNAFIAGRYYSDAAGVLGKAQLATATQGMYSPFGIGRWGDYSQTVVDPMDDQTMWSFQEYTASDDNFGVRAIQIKAPPPATPLPLNAISNKDNVWITVKGVSVDNSGFFDPGSDKGGPGYNRLSVKVTSSSGALIASNIRFDSPTQIRFWLSARNKPADKYTVIITNPDGQVVTTELDVVTQTQKSMVGANTMVEEEVQKYMASSNVIPNPTPGSFQLQVNAAQNWVARVVLMDVTGKRLSESRHSLGKGMNQIALSVAAYENGTYLAAVYNQKNVLIAVQKIVKH